MNTENQMSNANILHFMEQNTGLNVAEIADRLEISTMAVSQAQHEKLVRIFPRNKMSVAWSIPGYRVDPRSFLNRANFDSAIEKIKEGEQGVLVGLSQTYRISKAYMEALKSAAV